MVLFVVVDAGCEGASGQRSGSSWSCWGQQGLGRAALVYPFDGILGCGMQREGAAGVTGWGSGATSPRKPMASLEQGEAWRGVSSAEPGTLESLEAPGVCVVGKGLL